MNSLESKINLWYLDNGKSSDDYGTVLKDLKKYGTASVAVVPGLIKSLDSGDWQQEHPQP